MEKLKIHPARLNAEVNTLSGRKPAEGVPGEVAGRGSGYICAG